MIRRVRRDGGQAAVETALVLPLVIVLLLLVIQVGLIVRDHVMVTHAAREAARAAAVEDDDAAAARRAAIGSTNLADDRTTISVSGSRQPGGDVTVKVEYRSVTDVPLIGPLLGDVTMSASATMRNE